MTNDQILQDFIRRYHGTFVNVVDPKKTSSNLYLLEEIQPHPEYIGTLSLHSPEYGRLRINIASEWAVKFPDTPVGVFQHGGQAYYCRRVPRKQYRRGICRDNTRINTVTSAIQNLSSAMSWEILSSAMKRDTFTLKEALTMLNKRTAKSVALANNYAVSLPFADAAGSDMILYSWDVPIARITNTGKLVEVYEKIFTRSISKILEGI